MDRLRLALCLALLTAGGAAPATAQPTQTLDFSALEAQLGAVNSSLQEIAALLRAQVDVQRAELAVQRLDIARREVAELDRELHDAQTQRADHEQNRTRFIAQRDLIETGLDEEDADAEQRELMRRQFEIESQGMEGRMFRLDQRILDLQNTLTRAREDMTIWEELVADTLR